MPPPAPTFEEIVRKPVIYRIPGMDEVAVRRDMPYKVAGETPLMMDVYSPALLRAGSRAPAVLFVHGGPIPDPRLSPKDMGVFTSYGRLAAASGLVGVTFNHRFYGSEHLRDAARDVGDVVEYVRTHAEDLGVDQERIAVWAFSGGGPFLSLWMRDPPPYVRCLVAYYAVLDIQVPPPGPADTLGEGTRKEFSPLHHLAANAGRIAPMLIARAGLDAPELNATIDAFGQEALARKARVELVTHPQGRHGFDILDDDERSREVIRRTFEFLATHLGPSPSGAGPAAVESAP
jgi:acetyl esterase/lipase